MALALWSRRPVLYAVAAPRWRRYRTGRGLARLRRRREILGPLAYAAALGVLGSAAWWYAGDPTAGQRGAALVSLGTEVLSVAWSAVPVLSDRQPLPVELPAAPGVVSGTAGMPVAREDVDVSSASLAPLGTTTPGQPGSGASMTGERNEASPAGVVAPAYYVIADGDTLSDIADQYDTTVEALAALNNIEDRDAILVGDRLVLPR